MEGSVAKRTKFCFVVTFSILLSSLLGFYLTSKASANTTNNLIRQTQFGQIEGESKNSILDWKGVPYGGNVSGKNRWKSPTNPTKWTGVKKTTASLTALQYNNGKVVGEENNALTLDIYRPDTTTKNLPVIVYVHGGNNQTGSSAEISGANFVKNHNAIFVSVNYRLGVLGFNPLSALKVGTRAEESGNYALLDLHKSLSWVKNNIANFGGNSKNITIAGFSAGGRDVMAMLISPLFKNQFNKAIVFSGGMTLSNETKSQKVFAKALAPLVVQDKIKKTQKAAQKWLLAKKNAKQVRKYLYSIKPARLTKLMTNAQIRMANFPHLYQDGYVIPKNGFSTKNYNSVPVILFSGSREFSLFALTDNYFYKSFQNGTISTNKKTANKFNYVSKYGSQLYSRFNLEDSANKMLANGYKAAIYGMQMNFGNNAKVVGSKMGLLGAFHGVFVTLFDPDNTTYKPYVGDAYQSVGAKKLSTEFQNYIFNFINSGDGSSSKNSVTWAKYNSQHQTLRLSATKTNTIAVMKKKIYTDQTVFKELEKDKTISSSDKNYLIKHVLNGRWFSRGLDQKFNNMSYFEK
ncbi:carboxylesterase family protein [Liquorilactobacillus nagelii]|uniref:carboxylesterase family protein n=1 Tax=Liquorilactobacillus nagelii TaxID=82688 RepID=UPI001CCBE961|nr:carboxylesterase family protein [Liquorilactobacillus nagelii]ULQ49563.1 carboxylesterase family protein [Liquorilactobacillus nagelii]